MLIKLDTRKKKTLLKALAGGAIEYETLSAWLKEATNGLYISDLEFRNMSNDELIEEIKRLDERLRKDEELKAALGQKDQIISETTKNVD